MRKLTLIFLLSATFMFANPFAGVKKLFIGKVGWSVSIMAFGGSEAADYRTTRIATSCGAGHEGNFALTNTNGQLNANLFIGAKVATFMEPVLVEGILYYKMNDVQRQKWAKYFTIGNWVAAGVVSGVAARNHLISQQAGCV